MTALRPLIVPAIVLAVVAGFIVANLSGAEVDPLPTPTATRTPLLSPTPAPTSTPAPTPTMVSVTLDLTGTLVWTGGDGLTFRTRAMTFPGAELLTGVSQAGTYRVRVRNTSANTGMLEVALSKPAFQVLNVPGSSTASRARGLNGQAS